MATATKPRKRREGESVTEPASAPLPNLCGQLRDLQRHRRFYVKTLIMFENRLKAFVASELGYHAGLSEKERKAYFELAGRLIKEITKGKAGEIYVEDERKSAGEGCGEIETKSAGNGKKPRWQPARDAALVRTVVTPAVLHGRAGMQGYVTLRKNLETEMEGLAQQLPVADWVEHQDRRGFSFLSLAVLVGEIGNLSDYANPGKVWKRMGCAPFSRQSDPTDVRMPSSWRAKGGLSKEEWETVGYCPRRRAIVYVIGENLTKQNQLGKKDEPGHWRGPYRLRYDNVRAVEETKHPDWSKGQRHAHAMLLASKELLRDLWVEWNTKVEGRKPVKRRGAWS